MTGDMILGYLVESHRKAAGIPILTCVNGYDFWEKTRIVGNGGLQRREFEARLFDRTGTEIRFEGD